MRESCAEVENTEKQIGCDVSDEVDYSRVAHLTWREQLSSHVHLSGVYTYVYTYSVST